MLGKIDEILNSKVLQNILPFVVIIFIGFLIYSNVLRGEFISDDYIAIVDNTNIKDLCKISDIWWSFNTRFLVGITFAINYKISGFDVFGFHIINIIIHIINSFLVFYFFILLLKTPALEKIPWNNNKFYLTFLAALIYLSHPIQTQAVSYITQRATLMVFLFYLLTSIFYIRWRLENKRSFFMISLFFLCLGILCKSNIITLPITLFAIEVCFMNHKNIFRWNNYKQIIPFILIVACVPIMLLNDKAGSVYLLKGNISNRVFNWHYFLTELNVLVAYIKLFFMPVGQTHDHNIPIATSIWEWNTLFSIIVLLSTIIFSIKIYKKNKLLTFCVLWFFITTSVEAGVVCFVNRKVMDEHWLYLATAGLSMLSSYIIVRVIKNKKILRIIGVALIILLSVFTYKRNFIWQNEIIFWEDVIKKAPKSYGSYLALGNAYKRKGLFQQALAMYKKGLTLKPNYIPFFNNIGIIYSQNENNDLAVKYFNRILVMNPSNKMAYNNLGYNYYLIGDYKKAVYHYKKAIELKSDFPETYLYLGKCLYVLNKHTEAKKYLYEASRLYRKRNENEKALETEILLGKIK